jgi:hypothetical protein
MCVFIQCGCGQSEGFYVYLTDMNLRVYNIQMMHFYDCIRICNTYGKYAYYTLRN